LNDGSAASIINALTFRHQNKTIFIAELYDDLFEFLEMIKRIVEYRKI